MSTGLDLENVGSKVMGVLAEEYLVKLAADTHRGLRGRVERGRAPGAVPYGFTTERQDDGTSRILVVPEQAAVVERIFQLYAAGDGCKAIAHALNREGLAPPRPRSQKGLPGRSWSPSAIRELLRNQLYRGTYVWNRSEWIKDHETGRRRRHERPREDWIEQSSEDWRIIGEDLWARVQARIEERGGTMRYDGRSPTGRVPAPGQVSRPKHLLAGFLACEVCGGGFCSLSRGAFGCSWRRSRGAATCTNRLAVPARDLEARVLGAIREQILAPEALAYVVARAVALVAERYQGTGSDLPASRDRLAQLDTEIGKLVDLAARVEGIEEIARKLRDLQAERRRLDRGSAAAAAAFDPAEVRASLARGARDLEGVLAGDPTGGAPERSAPPRGAGPGAGLPGRGHRLARGADGDEEARNRARFRALHPGR